MKINFKGKIEDISMLMVSAERYALGRRTYMVSWTCEVIKNNLHLLTDNDRNVMIRDIENAVDYGDECDKAEWEKLLELLERS